MRRFSREAVSCLSAWYRARTCVFGNLDWMAVLPPAIYTLTDLTVTH